MRYKVTERGRFRKDLEHLVKRGLDMSKLSEVIGVLQNGEKLEPKYRDHPLKGRWQGCRECHIAPDWLLIYKYEEDRLVLILFRTGTHADLLGM